MINIEKLNFGVNTITSFTEVVSKNTPFVSWGVDNLFPNELYMLLDASPIHNSAVRARVDNSVGSGYINDYKINSKQYINDVAKQMFFELIVTGNLFLEVVWRKDRKEGLAGFHVIPSKYMRVHKPEHAGEPATKYLYSRDWANWRKGSNSLIEFSEFDPANFTNRQIIHIRSYGPQSEFYGVPSYLACINDIKLNHEITVFNLANVLNNCAVGLWVHFNQTAPDSEYEQNTVLRKIEDRYMGAENSGRIIVSYGEEGQKPDITQIQSNVEDGYFSSIFELVQHQILCGHNIPDASIIGLPQRTGFSSSADQLEVGFKLFLSTAIYPLQKFMNRELKPIIELIYPNQEIDLTITQNNII